GHAAGALAQSYPSRPITLVVPFPPGGPTDTTARLVADSLKTTLGQTVVIENVGGAGGTIGMAPGARAGPHGHTFGTGQWANQVGSAAMYPLPFHVLNDFEPISLLTSSFLWIVGRKDLPADDLKGLIGWMKANPAKTTAATVGAGSAAHLCLIYFESNTGT